MKKGVLPPDLAAVSTAVAVMLVSFIFQRFPDTEVAQLREESPEPQPLLGVSPSEISTSLPFSTQASAGRSIHANSVSTDCLSVNNVNNNSQNSKICRLIPEIRPGLNLPQDQTITAMIKYVPVMSSQVSEASNSINFLL